MEKGHVAAKLPAARKGQAFGASGQEHMWASWRGEGVMVLEHQPPLYFSALLPTFLYGSLKGDTIRRA